MALQVLLGRGRECFRHLLSIYVSRRHLEIKLGIDGSLKVKDLGVSEIIVYF